MEFTRSRLRSSHLYFIFILFWTRHIVQTNKHKVLEGDDNVFVGKIAEDLRPPSIIPRVKWITINEGDNYTINCVGDKKLTWQEDIQPSMDYADPDLSIDHYRNASGRKHGSTFIYRDSAPSNTGRHWCKYHSLPTYNTSVYVFVFLRDDLFRNFPDGTHSDHVYQLRVEPDKPATVPCLPTSPDIKVSLWKTTVRSERVRDPTVKFDPTRGFLIPKPSDYYNGMFKCIAMYGQEKRQEAKLLFTYFDGKKPNPPDVSASSLQVVVGQPFTITCTAWDNHPLCPDLKWKYENKEKKSSARIRTTKSICKRVSKGGRFYVETKSRLSVSRARLTDGTTYTCLARYKQWITNSSVTIVITKPFVVLGPYRVNEFHTSEGKEKILLSVAINASSIPTVRWYKDGIVIDKKSFRHINPM